LTEFEIDNQEKDENQLLIALLFLGLRPRRHLQRGRRSHRRLLEPMEHPGLPLLCVTHGAAVHCSVWGRDDPAIQVTICKTFYYLQKEFRTVVFNHFCLLALLLTKTSFKSSKTIYWYKPNLLQVKSIWMATLRETLGFTSPPVENH
jgi:hypothetical protein